MGEYANVAQSGQQATAGAPPTPTTGGSGTSTDDGWGDIGKPMDGTGTGTEPAPVAGGGGGQQADQTKERERGIPTGSIINPDGSRLTATEKTWEYTDKSGQTGEWSGGTWVDPTTKEPMPEGFGPPEDFAPVTASDWEHAAGAYNDWARWYEERGGYYGESYSEHYRNKYNEAVTKARELRAQESRR